MIFYYSFYSYSQKSNIKLPFSLLFSIKMTSEELKMPPILIDFEQLKIENQTLNEKIEERNEELHKLRTKITSTVVILSHTREKLQYIQEQNRVRAIKLQDLTASLTSEKLEQSRLKVHRETIMKTNLKLK